MDKCVNMGINGSSCGEKVKQINKINEFIFVPPIFDFESMLESTRTESFCGRKVKNDPFYRFLITLVDLLR